MSAPFQPELLLAHADFVRRLAASLVHDPSRADDLAQDVALGALRRPPSEAGGLRGWLAASARSIARNLWRAERREQARAAARAEEGHAPSPQEVLAREELRQRVVHAVLALEEPFRSTVLLRFYEDLSPRAIAARLRVPPATVRTRLERGLDRLRERLGADADPRAGGLLLLCPVRRAGLLVWCAMNAKLVVLGGVAAAALVLAWWMVGRASVAAPPLVQQDVAGAATTTAETATDEPAQRTAADPDAAAGGTDLPIFPATRPSGRLDGIVLDLAHARVPGASVELKPWIGVMPAARRIRDDRTRDFAARTDPGGTLTFVDVPEGPYMLTASAKGLSKRELVAVGPVTMGPTIVLLETPATYGDDVRVHVRDEDGKPVANASVALHGISAREGPIGFAGTEPPRGHTDVEGIWRVRGRSMRSVLAVATTADGRTGMARTERWVDPTELHVTVAAPGRVKGRLVGVGADELERATLDLHVGGAEGPVVSAPIAGDAFSFDALPAGKHALALRAWSGVRLVADPDQERTRMHPLGGSTLTLAVGIAIEIELQVARGSRIRGSVATGAAPVPGARVRIRPAMEDEQRLGAIHCRGSDPWTDLRISPQYAAHATTDGDGRYAVDGLPPGPYAVEVLAPGLSVDRRVPVELKEGLIVDLAHSLHTAGALQVAGSAGLLAVIPQGSTKPLLVVGAWDCLTLPGLAPGRYALRRRSPFGGDGLLPLAEFTIEAGRTTWLDLRELAYQASIRGVVRSGTRVLSGAAVSKGDARSITDADGNYVLRHHDAGSIWSGGSAPLAVHAHGLEYQVRLPHDDYRNTAPTLDVQLGEHELIVDVADLRGQPCAATLVFSGGAPAEIGQVHAVQGTRPIQSGDRVRLALLPRCRMRIEATFASGVVDVAEVDIPTTPYVLVQDRPCGTLRVRTLADCGVTARTWRGKGPAPVGEGQFTDAWYRGGNTDSDGRVVLRGVIAGEILLRVDGPGSSKALRFALAPGETKDLVVDLPR